jgi:hypothetical protein
VSDEPKGDELKSEVAVSHPAKPKAMIPAKTANATGFVLCQAAAASKVVTATLPH